MRLLVDINHPAHVHQFKNTIDILRRKGHDVLVTARNKEITLYLLDVFGIEYKEIGEYKSGFVSKSLEMLKIDRSLYNIAKDFNPDILIGGVGNVYVAHVSSLIRRPSILFNDTEHAYIQNLISFPFASTICTPSCYYKDLGAKQIRYNGYHELAYLHPSYFSPNSAVLDALNLSKNDIYIVLRIVSWGASHDFGQHGIENKLDLVKKLSDYGQVLITSEGSLSKDLENYKVRVPPEQLHDLLYFASLYFGEGATIASESAVLGTHAVYVNTLRLGYLEDQSKYGLVYTFSDANTMGENSLNKALDLLSMGNLRAEGKRKAEKLLKDKIDVTAFFVNIIENYPQKRNHYGRTS